MAETPPGLIPAPRPEGDADRAGLSVEAFESRAFTLVAVVLDSLAAHGTGQALLVRRAGEESWRPVYAAPKSRWTGPVAADVRGFEDDETVTLNLCIGGCHETPRGRPWH